MSKRTTLWILVLLLLAGPMTACGRSASSANIPEGTPPASQSTATAEAELAQTAPAPSRATPSPVATATPTRTRPVATATPTRRPADPAIAGPAATPTPRWPAEIVISDEEVEALAASSTVEGLTTSGLQVSFENDTMTVRFDSLRYGLFSLRDVEIQGHLELADGRVSFVADRIVPRNLVTGTIPAFINQSLGQSLSAWYVEDLRVEPGQLVLLVRPRSAS